MKSKQSMTIRRLLFLSLALAATTVRSEDPPGGKAFDAGHLFDRSRLLEIRIEMPEKDWQALCAQTRDFTDALGKGLPRRPFTCFKGNVVVDGKRIDGVGIRKKGFLGSLDDERPSLKIKFDEYEKKEPLVGVDCLTLNNNKQDVSLASQYLAYGLFARAGVAASRCNLARVTVNGVDLGIYSNVEAVGKPLLERHFGEGSGRLYEGTLVDFFADRLDRFEGKANQSEDERGPLKRVAEILGRDGNLSVKDLESAVDIDAFLRYWVVESLIGFWDGYTNNQNNFFVYENPKNSRLYWIPWGTDSAFLDPPPLPFLPRGPDSVRAHSALAHRLYRDEQVRERYRKTLLEVLDSVWREEQLLAELDALEKVVGDDRIEQQRGFKSHLVTLRKFIEGRRAAVMADLKRWPVEVAESPRRPMYMREAGSATGSFSTTWRKDSPKDPYANGQAKLEMVLNKEPVEFKQLGVSAEPSQPAPGEREGKERPPAIIYTGERKSDGKKLTLAVVTTRELFRPDAKTPVPVQGMLLQGTGFFSFGGMRFVSGTATFTSALMEPDAPVEGRVELKILRMHQP